MGSAEQLLLGGLDHHRGERLLGVQVGERRQAAEMTVYGLRPGRTPKFFLGLTQQQDAVPRLREAHRDALAHIVDDAQDAHLRGGQDIASAGLVVEAHVAAGHRHAERPAAVHQSLDGLHELPHDFGVFRRTEVQAVGHRDRLRTRDRHIAVGLGQCQLGTQIGIELAVPAVGVGCQCDTQVGEFVDAHHAGIIGLRQHGVATHEAIVLIGHPAAIAQIRRRDQPEQLRCQLGALAGARQMVVVVGVQRVDPVRAALRAVVGRSLVGDGAGVDVDDALTMPVDVQPVTLDQFADHRGLHIPLRTDLHEPFDVVRLADRHHAFLGLAHQDLFGAHRVVAQRHQIELTVHAAVAGRSQLAGRTRDTRGTEVLQCRDDARGEQFEGAFDEQLLHEGVAHLHGRTLRRLGIVEGLRGQDRRAANTIGAGRRSVEDDLVANPGRLGELQVLMPHDAHAQRVDQRIVRIGGVEVDLAADIGQSKTVAVAADAGNDSGQHTGGVGGFQRAEPQSVHDCDRSGAHRQDVADDAAHTGGRPLVGLDERRMVV